MINTQNTISSRSSSESSNRAFASTSDKPCQSRKSFFSK